MSLNRSGRQGMSISSDSCTFFIVIGVNSAPSLSTEAALSTRAVAPHHVLKAVKRQSIDRAVVFASHRLRHAKGVEYRLLRGLGSRAKKAGHGGRGQHADIRDFLVHPNVLVSD
jgi:hypothetical protein